jgi:hypothetical protein
MNLELELYKERLNKILDLLESNNLKPFLLCGTLLAFIREGKPFSHDYKDIDIALPAKDYWKVREIIDNSSEWTYYRVWRKEIAVYYKERKVDIFFLEEDNQNNLFIYSYKLNSFTRRYDTEWRTIFKANDFYPLKIKQYDFLGREVFIPNNFENVLTTHYGDWKTPNSKWTVNEMTNIDKKYRQIGFLIPTFLRDEKVKRCIESIYKTFPRDWYRIHIGDQNNNEKYNYLHSDDNFYKLEYNTGLAKTRQHLINQVSEPFLIIMDDDFIFTKESDLNIFIQILLDKEINGIVGGQLKNYNRQKVVSYFQNIKYDTKSISKIEINPKYVNTFKSKSQLEQKYSYGDLVLNFFMAKKEIFDITQYDKACKLIEHLDFFLRFKLENKYKVTFTPNVYVEHQNESNSKEYLKYRHWQNGENVKIGFQRFKEKWGIDLKNIKIIKLKK